MTKAKLQNREGVLQILHHVVQLGMLGVLVLAPLVMGGRFDPGRLVLSCLIAGTAIAWFVSRLLNTDETVSWSWTGVEWIVGAAVLIVTLQLLPLSSQTLSTVSPAVQDLLPLFAAADPASDGSTAVLFPAWQTVSLAPHATRGGLAMAMMYAVFFLVVLQQTRSRRDIERLIKVVAVAGIVMSGIGLAQYLFGNGKFLWFMEHPSRDTLTAVKGTFANENHFAHFLALSLGPLLWWLVKLQPPTDQAARSPYRFDASRAQSTISLQQVLLCLGLATVVLAALLSYSRGGLSVMAVAAAAVTGLFVYQRRVGRAAIIAVSVVILVAAVAVWIHGRDILLREVESLQHISMASLDQDQGRRRIWSAVWEAAPNFALLGSGVGTHRYVYPTFFPGESNVQYTHAESGFLHVLLETGVFGVALLLVAIGLSGFWLVRALLDADKQVAFLAVPLLASWLVSLIHAVFDFNWFIPANMCLTLVVLALAVRLTKLGGGRGTNVAVPKASWLALTCIVIVAALFSIDHFRAPALAHSTWHEFRAWSLASKRFLAKSVGPGRQRSLGYVDGSDPQVVAQMIDQLRASLEQNPDHGRAHVRMAALCLRQFELLQANSENAMSLAQIRDAALTAGFGSHLEMTDWVARVVGSNGVLLDRAIWHCKQGLRLTPTEGLGYLYLAEVAFLDESLKDAESALVHQAYCVRPHDPGVQFAYGRHKLLAGETDRALMLWKHAFRHGSQVRGRIIAALAFQVSPQEILKVFQPELEGLRDLFEYYRHRELTPQVKYVAPLYVAELERQANLMSGEPAGRLWMQAQFVHATIGNADAAAQAARNAVMSQPGEYENHFACALRMRDADRLPEAIHEFRWCQARRPEDPTLARVVLELQQQLRQARARDAERHGGRQRR